MSVDWAPHQDEVLRRMWREGVYLKDIAAAIGVSFSAVYRRSCKLRLGIHPKSTRKRTMNHKTKARILRMRADGAQLFEMARATGFSGSAISLFLKGQGQPFQIRDETVTHVDVPQPVLADREHRSWLEPRDLTAAFMGDPLPGYSALERP